MHVALITVGDTTRLTGGYLYQSRLIAGLRERGVTVAEVVASGASIEDQRAAADAFGRVFDARAYDVIVVDALARAVCAAFIDGWRTNCPVVVLVHQLPSVAEQPTADDRRPSTAEGQQITDATVSIAGEADDGLDTAGGQQSGGEAGYEAALLGADALIAVSGHGRDILLARGVVPERITIVSPGFDRLGAVSRVVPTPRGATLQALCVAQWIPRKGIVTLVRAWQRANLPHARLVLIGETDADPDYSHRVREAIADDAHAIDVRGIVGDAELRQAYRDADVFVLPTRFEGYGMVYAEALAYGVPVIASNVGPIPELVTTAAGRFVAPDDERALAQTITTVLGDAALRARLAAGARQRATQLPTWDDAVAGFMRVFAQVTRP